ncbi:MAG: T9SS type A sorting domain-containing protein [Chryseobacterium sp.]|jgi:hypothetical protein|uniref:T9SS type A sorting domain-containing protein n=1 Tax=Chryseobacterium sp. TaxID=1871047 RepID=UPI002832201A|nr:T9SS type A sorting domain-containing protein [Chryseobacterium sp.]MDR2237596.1 T9SS type A sorting domain-containing protein [Chryseobacterium sp.]
MKQFYPFSFRKEKTNYLKTALLGIAALLSSNNISAQVNTYMFTQSAGTYTPITGTVLAEPTGNTAATSLDNTIYPVDLPFGFVFNGTSYSSLNISTNGFVTFGTTAPTTTNYSPISSTAGYEGVIAAWAKDLNTVFDINGTTGNISWETRGTAPNREVVIQWKDFRPAYSASTTSAYVFSFQVILQETSNTIKTMYSSGAFLVGSTSVSSTVQIGLRGSSNTDFNNRLNGTSLEFINATAGTSNSSSQAFNSSNTVPGMPSDGLTYTWAPPTCWAPSGINITGITTNAATVNWTAPTNVPANGYDIYYSTSNTAPDASTQPDLTGITGLSAALPPLQPSTSYFVWVRSVCSPTDKSNWSSVTSFATQCDALPGAYFEGFEGYQGVLNGNAGVLPVCWTNLGTNNGGHISNSTTITGNNTLYMWTSGARVAYVALPAMSTLQSGSYRLKFDAKASVTAGGILQIGYLDTSNNFVELTTFSVTSTGTVYPFSYDIPVLPAGVTQLALKNPGTPERSLSIDNVSYEPKTLGTSEVAKKDPLKIYPNPFSDVIGISEMEKVKSISVIDVSGRMIRTIENISSEINLSDLKTGLYILKVQYKDGTNSSHKIIKK